MKIKIPKALKRFKGCQINEMRLGYLKNCKDKDYSDLLTLTNKNLLCIIATGEYKYDWFALTPEGFELLKHYEPEKH